MTIELNNSARAAAIVTASELHQDKCHAIGMRYEFDFGAMLDSFYPDIPAIDRDAILGNVYKLLK